MSTVSSTSAKSIIDQLQQSGSTNKSTDELGDRFLTLLVTQMQNQDPLNPMDNAQMTTQLAQMSTVSGIEKLNTTLNSLVESLGSTQAQEASALIGKGVMVPGSQLSLASGKAYGAINLAADADNVKISILDSAGNVIKTESLGAQKAGVIDFGWDGATDSGTTATDGTYKFTVEATQGGNAVTVTALQLGTVSALVRSSSGFLLDLGALGKVDFKNVQQIL